MVEEHCRSWQTTVTCLMGGPRRDLFCVAGILGLFVRLFCFSFYVISCQYLKMRNVTYNLSSYFFLELEMDLSYIFHHQKTAGVVSDCLLWKGFCPQFTIVWLVFYSFPVGWLSA